MMIIKTYILSEKSLEKDIDKFIIEVKNAKYQYDYRYGGEGVKILKAYFRFIEKEIKNNNFKEVIIIYEKLFSMLFQKKI